MGNRCAVAVGIALLLAWAPVASAGQSPRLILGLGDTAFITPAAAQAIGAEVSRDPAVSLKQVSVLVFANTPLSALPDSIRAGLVEYLESGGTLLITGGPQSFGSGGYKAVSGVMPFEIRSENDWRFITFRPPVAVQAGHPLLAGVTFGTVGTVNDMNPRRDATEILQSPGGGRAATVTGGSGGGSYLYPLIAEIGVGSGRVVGVAFDVNDSGAVRDRDLFVRNALTYLLVTSRAGLVR